MFNAIFAQLPNGRWMGVPAQSSIIFRVVGLTSHRSPLTEMPLLETTFLYVEPCVALHCLMLISGTHHHTVHLTTVGLAGGAGRLLVFL